MTLGGGALILLYLLVVPYIGLLLLVILGSLHRPIRARSEARPSVSVVLPAHNEEGVLAETLASLAAQRYSGRLEFVLVDDRSTDRTAAIARTFCQRDERFRLLRIRYPSRRLAPKVNAVQHGIEASSGEIILTTDADCLFPEGWVEELVSHFHPDVSMVIGYVEPSRRRQATSTCRRFESCDWLSLMLVARALLRFGWQLASSANNQAYRRSAFQAIGGFGPGARAPSGDEDLLIQRMGRLSGGRVVFADAPAARVLTRPQPTWKALLRQRRRWVSRYQHPQHYHLGFWSSVTLLGFQSIALSLAVLLMPVFPASIPWVCGLWGAKLTAELAGMHLGTGLFQRRDLWPGAAAVWALIHPFFIATALSWSLLRPGEWRAGTAGKRGNGFRIGFRLVKRRLRTLVASRMRPGDRW